MKRSDLAYLVGSLVMAVTAVCYCATIWFSIRVPRYYPLEHTWKWVNEKGVPSQGWYGMQAFAYLAAGAVALLAYVVLRRAGGSPATPLSRGTVRGVALGSLGITLVCLGYLLFHEFHKWGILG